MERHPMKFVTGISLVLTLVKSLLLGTSDLL